LFSLHKSRKAVETFGPETLVAVEPIHRLLHRSGGQAARHGAAGLGARDQAGIRQHVEMLHDSGQRHRKRPCEFADRHVLFVTEPGEERSPGRIGKRRKGAVQRLVSILNHMV